MHRLLTFVLVMCARTTCSLVAVIGDGGNARELIRRFVHENVPFDRHVHENTRAIVIAMPEASFDHHARLVVDTCHSPPHTCHTVCLVSSLAMVDTSNWYDDYLYDDTELRSVCWMELCEYTVLSLPPRIRTRIFRPNASPRNARHKLLPSEHMRLVTDVVNWMCVRP